MLKKLWFTITTFIVISSTPLAAATLPDAATVSRYTDQLVQQQVPDQSGPGLVVLVARGDQLLFEKAYGQANIELGVPLSTQHAFRIGSVTKQMAAVALLKLIDENKASLQDPLNQFLPDYPNGDTITLAQLLNHTSGVKSYTDIPNYLHNPIRRDLSTAELINEFQDWPVDFLPGTDFRYNNSGYVLLGAVIEAISGTSWHQYITNNLLQQHPLPRLLFPSEQTLILGMAGGYSVRSGESVKLAAPLSMTQPHAAGALVADAHTLWQWNRLLHGGKLLSESQYQQMITPSGAAAKHDGEYGFGIISDELRGLKRLHHGGGINGFLSLLVYLPETEISVVLLRNSDGQGPDLSYLGRKIAAYAAGNPYPEYPTVSVSKAELHEVSGIYTNGDDSRTLDVRDGQLYSTRAGGRPILLLPKGNDRFGFINSVAQLTIHRDESGRASSLSFYQNGDGTAELWSRGADVEVKLEISLSQAQQQALVGTYASEQLQLRIFQNDSGNGLLVQVSGQPPFELKASSAHSLYLTVVDANLEFSPAEGPAQKLILKQGPGRFVLKRQ